MINEKIPLGMIKKCDFIKNNIVIDTNGDILPCFHNKQVIGNIKMEYRELAEHHDEFFCCLSMVDYM